MGLLTVSCRVQLACLIWIPSLCDAIECRPASDIYRRSRHEYDRQHHEHREMTLIRVKKMTVMFIFYHHIAYAPNYPNGTFPPGRQGI